VSVNGSKAKPPVERALQVFLYAPVGLALMAWQTVPNLVGQLVSRSCAQLGEAPSRVAGQVRQARMIGQVAVAYGGRQVRREVDTRLAEARRRAEGLVAYLPGVGGGGEEEDLLAEGRVAVAPPMPAPAPVTAPAPASVEAAPVWPATSAGTVSAGAPAVDAPPAAELPIPEYDGLSASQVVSRLTGLSPSELSAVRAYEAAGRGRKTVLAAIDRLV
jgi:hypothetical protein